MNNGNHMHDDCIKDIANKVIDVVKDYTDKCGLDAAAGYMATVIGQTYNTVLNVTPERREKLDTIEKEFLQVVVGLGKVQGLSTGDILIVMWDVVAKLNLMLGKGVDFTEACATCPKQNMNEGGANG